MDDMTASVSIITVSFADEEENMLSGGMEEIDVHGMTVDEAVKAVIKKVNSASGSVYRIKVIHGYHGGTRIKEAIEDEFAYNRVPKVKRVAGGSNPGITELILREF